MSDVCKALAAAMKREPHQRVCQLIFNALDKHGKARFPNGQPSDLFYVTDNDLLNALAAYSTDSGRRKA